MKGIIAVIGNASIDKDEQKQELAFEIGKLIIENGFLLATGGMGGVMAYASKGARSASNYKPNSIIGILPTYSPSDGNQELDIPITTGLGMLRNTLLVSTASAVIAIGGGSGTLNEISTAWQMNKLIIALKIAGWSGKLAGESLDKRRPDRIFAAKTAEAAIELLLTHFDRYQTYAYSGIKKQRLGEIQAKANLEQFYGVKELEFLGSGSEGYVFKGENDCFKIIDKAIKPLGLYWNLLALSHQLKQVENLQILPNFTVAFEEKRQHLYLRYPYLQSQSFFDIPKLTLKACRFFLAEMKRLNWVLVDFQPKNIRLQNGELIIIDIGHSLYPFSPEVFESMKRRIFVTYKLQGKLTDYQDFKQYLTPVNIALDFSMLVKDFGFNLGLLEEEYRTAF